MEGFKQVVGVQNGIFDFLDAYGFSNYSVRADSLSDVGSGYLRALRNGQSYLIQPKKSIEVQIDFSHIIFSECPNLLFLVNKDNAYLVTKDGEQVYPEALDAPNPSSYYSEHVHLGYFPYCIASKNGKKGLFDMDGRLLLAFEFDNIYRTFDNNSFLKVQKGNGYGLYNLQSEELSAVNYQGIDRTRFGLFRVQKEGKFGLLNQNFEIVLPLEYDHISQYDNEHGFRLLKDTKVGAADSLGNLSIPANYNSVKLDKELLWAIGQKNQYSHDFYSKKTGKKEFSYNCSSVSSTMFSGYNRILLKNGGSCIIDSMGTFFFCNTNYGESVYLLTADKVVLRKNGVEYLLFLDGSAVFEKPYLSISRFGDVFVVKDKDYHLHNLDGKKLDDTSYTYMGGDRFANYMVAKKGDKYGFINKQGKVVLPFEFDFAEPHPYKNRYAVQKNGKWGYLDGNLQVVIPLEYDYADTFNPQLNMAVVLKKGKYQWIDTFGTYLQDFDYSKQDEKFTRTLHISALSNNPETKDLGFVNSYTGQFVLPVESSHLSSSERGLIIFDANYDNDKPKKVGLKNYAGEIVVNPFCDGITVRDFDYRDFARFYKNGKQGIVKTDGTILLKAKYDVISFDENLNQFKVSESGKNYSIPFPSKY